MREFFCFVLTILIRNRISIWETKLLFNLLLLVILVIILLLLLLESYYLFNLKKYFYMEEG